jgi:hypothetical protein
LRRRDLWSCTLLAAAGLFGGCATPPPLIAVNPALFGRGPVDPGSQAAGRVAVLVPKQVAGQVAEGDPRVPIGQIVAQAVLGAVGDAFAGGARQVTTVPRDGDGFAATLVVDAIRCTYKVRLLWLVPLPIPFMPFIGDSEPGMSLELDVRLMDGQGRQVWARSYKSGREVWVHEPMTPVPSDLTSTLAHSLAWRLSQEATSDLREWLAEERSKPRDL